MAAIEMLIGTLTDVYTDVQYQAGGLPRLGDWYFDEVANAKYFFAKLSTGTLDAKEFATSLGVSRAFLPTSATPTPTVLRGAGAANNQPFAGVRVVGATQMTTTNCYGWLQISGGATFIADAAGTTADAAVISSNATAGAVEVPAAYAAAQASGSVFGLARTTTTSGDVVVDITSNCWGI